MTLMTLMTAVSRHSHLLALVYILIARVQATFQPLVQDTPNSTVPILDYFKETCHRLPSKEEEPSSAGEVPPIIVEPIRCGVGQMAQNQRGK